MSGPEMITVAVNLILAVGLFAFCRRRDRAIVKATAVAEVWRQPLNSYPLQSPLQN